MSEFTAFFGGCSVIDHVQGWYRAKDGSTVEDTITIIYSDTPKLHARDERAAGLSGRVKALHRILPLGGKHLHCLLAG